jgi:multidrug efflux pump subunit AcrA (membrane-fusion protein)
MNIRRRGRAGKLSTLVPTLAVGLLVGGVAGYLGSGWFRAQETSRGGSRAPLEVTRITALGRLEPRDGIVTISGLPGDRIEEILVQPGRQVGKGTPLVRLASHEERRLARDLVQTQLNEALAQKAELERQKQAQLEEIDAELAKIRSGQEQDLTAQDARIALITTQERLARTQLERLKGLKLTQVSQQELDQQALQVEQAER